MYYITKKFEISCAHRLRLLSPNHPCTYYHGHNYEIDVELAAHELTDAGMVLDYHEFKELTKEILVLDHNDLNRLLPFNPTAENLANYFFEGIRKKLVVQGHTPRVRISRVTVKEGAKTSATYQPIRYPDVLESPGKSVSDDQPTLPFATPEE